MLHPVLAAHLLDDQLAIAANDDVAGAQLPGLFHRGDKGAIFRDIVRRASDEPAQRNQRRAVAGANHDADSGRSWIAAAAAVELERDDFLGIHPWPEVVSDFQLDTRPPRPICSRTRRPTGGRRSA